MEEVKDFAAAHGVEVIGNRSEAGKETKAANLLAGGRVQGGHFDQRLAGFGDNKGFSFGGFFDQTREMSFGFVDVYGIRDCVDSLN